MFAVWSVSQYFDPVLLPANFPYCRLQMKRPTWEACGEPFHDRCVTNPNPELPFPLAFKG